MSVFVLVVAVLAKVASHFSPSLLLSRSLSLCGLGGLFDAWRAYI